MWGESQVNHARKTCAWKYLKNHGAKPTFVIFSGAVAVSAKSPEYFVLNKVKSPFPHKGKAEADEGFKNLRDQTEQIRRNLLDGLDVLS
jgi:hypothetical protein